jgi:hypothetical protein
LLHTQTDTHDGRKVFSSRRCAVRVAVVRRGTCVAVGANTQSLWVANLAWVRSSEEGTSVAMRIWA